MKTEFRLWPTYCFLLQKIRTINDKFSNAFPFMKCCIILPNGSTDPKDCTSRFCDPDLVDPDQNDPI